MISIDSPEFIRLRNPGVMAREDDIFTEELFRMYEPKVAQLSETEYLHYLRRRER